MKWQSTFEAYPDADEIFVAGGMPFLTKSEAQSHLKVAREGEVVKVTRAEAFAGEQVETGEADGTTAGAGESGEGGEAETAESAGATEHQATVPPAKKPGRGNKK
jgi:hypothetical protein